MRFDLETVAVSAIVAVLAGAGCRTKSGPSTPVHRDHADADGPRGASTATTTRVDELDGPYPSLERYCDAHAGGGLLDGKSRCTPGEALASTRPFEEARSLRLGDPVTEDCSLAVRTRRGWYLESLGGCSLSAGTAFEEGTIAEVKTVELEGAAALMFEWSHAEGPRRPEFGDEGERITRTELHVCALDEAETPACRRFAIGASRTSFKLGPPKHIDGSDAGSLEHELATKVEEDWRLDYALLPSGELELRLRKPATRFVDHGTVGRHRLTF